MKILVDEYQYNELVLKNILSEQIPDTRFAPRGMSDKEHRAVLYGSPEEQAAVRFIMELGATMLPIVGPFIGAALGGYYAQDELSKGNTKTAAVIGTLSLLPFIPQIRSAIPSLSKLGKNGIETLANKINGVSKVPPTPVEKEIIAGLALSKPIIEKNFNRIGTAVKSTVDYKSKYIRTFGQQKFNELFGSLVSGKLTKQQYIDELVGGLKDTYTKVSFKTIAGVKFSPQEQDAIVDLAKKIQGGHPGDTFKLSLSVNGSNQEVKIILGEYPPSAFDMAAKVTKDEILVNTNNVSKFTHEKLLNTLSHEAAHIKDLSFRSNKMTNEYENILREIVKWENLGKAYIQNFGENSAQVFNAKKQYASWFTKYQYHYQEMLANNSKVMQSLSRNITDVIGQYGVPETQKMINAVEYGISKNLPMSIDFYLDKLIGRDNAMYIRRIKSFDKNLYQDLLKKLSKQIDYVKSQLKLYQQY